MGEKFRVSLDIPLIHSRLHQCRDGREEFIIKSLMHPRNISLLFDMFKIVYEMRIIRLETIEDRYGNPFQPVLAT